VKRGVGKTPVEYIFIVGGGRGQHSDGEQTTKTWEADEHANR
jgi:hypothetical protein